MQRERFYRIATVSDITERKRAEADLSESRRRSDELPALLDTLQTEAPIGFGFVDRTHRFVRVNKALGAIIGVADEDPVGRQLEDIAADLWPGLKSVYRTILEEGRSYVNLSMRRKTSTPTAAPRDWLASFYPVRVADAIIGIGIILVGCEPPPSACFRFKLRTSGKKHEDFGAVAAWTTEVRLLALYL